LGELYEALGQDVKAEVALQTALQTSPEHIPTLLTMGHLKNRQNRTSESNSWFSRALTISPNSPEVHHHIGMAAASRGDVAGAESAYVNALQLAGTHLESLRALATLLREQGRYEKSEEVLRTLQAHHPSSESYGDYGAILHLNGKFQEAKKFYEKSLHLDPRNYLVKENLRKLERKMASAKLT
ncbi:tetratricopeptide repeat protein, partial [Ancylostoma caninum]